MPCDLATIQAAACANRYGMVQDRIKLLQAIAQNSAAWVLALAPGTDLSLGAIQDRMCDSRIGRVRNPIALLRIIAKNICGLGSGDDCVEPASPTNLQGFGSASAADLSWDYGADPALDFIIKYGTTPGGPYPLETLPGFVTPSARVHGLSGLTPATTYYAVIVARTTTTCFSADSNETTFTTT